MPLVGTMSGPIDLSSEGLRHIPVLILSFSAQDVVDQGRYINNLARTCKMTHRWFYLRFDAEGELASATAAAGTAPTVDDDGHDAETSLASQIAPSLAQQPEPLARQPQSRARQTQSRARQPQSGARQPRTRARHPDSGPMRSLG